MRVLSVILLCGGLVLSLPSYANPSVVTGVYGNLSLHQDTGDLLGVELFIFKAEAGYMVLFQAAEGAPAVPSLLPITFKGQELSFTVPVGHAYGGTRFVGRFEDGVLVLRLEGGALAPDGTKQLRLKRGTSYWQ